LFILCVFFVYFSFLPCDDESSYINKNISIAIKSWTACRDNTNKSFAEGKSISLSEGSVASPQGGGYLLDDLNAATELAVPTCYRYI